jgi:hypothetical protein
MTDIEYDVLDELYFVQSFDNLQKESNCSEIALRQVLEDLFKKGWLKCYTKMDVEVFEDEIDFDKNYKSYLYLASKKGLMAHNGR